MDELLTMGAAALAAAIAAGEVSSREVLDAHVARVEAVDPALNAVTVRLYDEARDAATAADEAVSAGDDLGPLHGVPVSIKDQFLVRGTPTTLGLPSRADHRADREGPLVTRLRNAGAIPFLKTNVPVLLLESETHNPLYGRTNNPWDLERTPGGSSGGESALIAAHGSPLGLGADIGGSLRLPSHDTGIATIKPTPHRLPWGDNLDREWQEAIVPSSGPMARTVRDVVRGFEVLATGRDHLPPEPGVPPLPWRDPDAVDVGGLRVGITTSDGGVEVSPAVRRAVHEAARALEAAGAEVVEWTPPDAERSFGTYVGLLGGDGFRHAARRLGDDPASPVLQLLTLAGRVPGGVGPVLAAGLRALGQDGASHVVRNAGTLSTEDYFDRLLERGRMQDELAAEFRDGLDVILMPPHALPAMPHGRFRDLVYAGTFTFLVNLLGLPAGVVPVTRVRPGEESDRRPGLDVVARMVAATEAGSAGLPVGVQVVAPWWREDVVLAAMAVVERGVDGAGSPEVPGVDGA